MKKSKQITLLDLKNSFESSLKSNNKELTNLILSTKEEVVEKIDEVLFSVKASFNEVDDKFAVVDQKLNKVDNRLGEIDNRLGEIENDLDEVKQDLSFVKSKINTQTVTKAYLDDKLSHYKKITAPRQTQEVLAI